VEIDPEMFRLVVEQREAQLKEAEVNLQEAERNFKRAKTLYEKSTVSESVYESAEVALNVAKVKKSQAEINLEIARRDLRKTRIVAPKDGVILQKFGERGEMIQAGQVLVQLGNYDRVEVEVGFSESQVIHLSLGQQAEVKVDSHPNELYTGLITSIGVGSTEATGNFPVVIRLDNFDHRLLPGMVGRVRVSGQVHRGILLVPQQAVRDRFGELQLFVYQDGIARLRKVKIGRVFGEFVQVLSGVQAGELVITAGHGELRDGSPVSPLFEDVPAHSL
jgi:RND family efflux transporter MFP subunit